MVDLGEPLSVFSFDDRPEYNRAIEAQLFCDRGDEAAAQDRCEGAPVDGHLMVSCR